MLFQKIQNIFVSAFVLLLMQKFMQKGHIF